MITIALSVKNKLGFINVESQRPEDTSLDLQYWEQCNNMVISCILNDISKGMLYSTTVKEIWSELEECFGQSNGAQLFEVEKELNQISHGSSSIVAHYTKNQEDLR